MKENKEKKYNSFHRFKISFNGPFVTILIILKQTRVICKYCKTIITMPNLFAGKTTPFTYFYLRFHFGNVFTCGFHLANGIVNQIYITE